MNTAAIKKMTIIQALSRIPETSLDSVKMYLDNLQADVQVSVLKNQSLKGIWKNAGFEHIVNLEDEVRAARQELQETILTRQM
ncbi:MAG: hypothetical protein GY750_16010 [Lentisphaerae bacterium]|nr:hypothetical protein [Lentisphaerota bacterium]